MGHAAGDEILIESARRICGSIRDSDIAARLGGDEFSVLLPNINSIESTEDVAEKILAKMRETFLVSAGGINITASIGIVMFSGENTDLEGLMNSADLAMYKAKQSGRDRLHFLSLYNDQSELDRS